jgi:hypothetical protein
MAFGITSNVVAFFKFFFKYFGPPPFKMGQFL